MSSNPIWMKKCFERSFSCVHIGWQSESGEGYGEVSKAQSMSKLISSSTCSGVFILFLFLIHCQQQHFIIALGQEKEFFESVVHRTN